MFSAIPDVLLSVLAALFVAGGIKFLLNGVAGTWTLLSFVNTGGMPSQHTAIVSALTMSILMTEGLSTSFAISLALSGIVIRDAFGIRRTVGEESAALAQLLKKNGVKRPLHISPGHTPLQVVLGALIGIVIALAITFK